MKEDNELYQYNPEHYCAIYARRSIRNNKDNIENQLAPCRDKAFELGLMISEEYCDFESATKYEPFHRPGFKQLIYDMKRNKFKYLIAFKRDRLARKTMHFKEIKYLCKQNGVKIIYASSDEGFLDDGSEISSLIENILVSFSEIEPENIKLRTKDGLDRKRASGKFPISSKVPKGYKKVGRSKYAELAHDPHFAPIMKDLFDKFSESSLTKEEFLNISKYIKAKYSLNINTSTLKNILKSPIYTGFYTRLGQTGIENLLIFGENNNISIDKDELIQATNVNPIIKDFDFWKNIVIKYFDKNGFSDSYRVKSSVSMFSNIIYCKSCGSVVHLIGDYFVCANDCFRIKKESLLNKLVPKIIDDLITHEEISNYYENQMQIAHSEINALEKKLKDIDEKQNKLLLKMIKYKTTSNPNYDNLETKKKSSQNRYAVLKEMMSEYMYYKENLYNKITSRERNLLVQHFIKNEHVTNDFLKTIIKKVNINVSNQICSSKIQYKCSRLSKSIR